MKNLKLISFVGADKLTDLEKVKEICLSAPISTEFSVLFSDTKSKQQDNRYPSYDFCNSFLQEGRNNNLLYSLHLCGTVIDRYFRQDQDVIDLCRNAYRIQLNLNIRQYPDVKKLSQDILQMASTYNHFLILQENISKQGLVKQLIEDNPEGKTPICFLHDGSGGFGREISKFKTPYQLYFTGYAGGINPENVVSIVNRIENVAIEPVSYYIDMESGIRENNIFSLEKCLQVINNLKIKL